MAVILNGATGGIQLTSASGGTMSVNPPATATSYVSTLPAATGTLLNSASSLPAANLTGTVPTARLGSGTASSSTFLAGDQSYKTISTGGVTHLGTMTTTSGTSQTITSLDFTGINCLLFAISQVSHSDSTGRFLQIGVAGLTPVDVGDAAITAANSIRGFYLVDLRSNTTAIWQTPNQSIITTGSTHGGGGTATGLYNVGTNLKASASTTVVAQFAGGVTFDNGKIEVYGLK